jgi:hypothetical protein
LPHPRWHQVFSARELIALSGAAGFRVEFLSGCIGKAAIVAKQLAWAMTDQPVVLRALVYPVEWMMTLADEQTSSNQRSTLMWLLKARLERPVQA